MGTRVRKQVYLDERQNQEVKRLAREDGVSESEVIRRAIDGLTSVGAEGGTDPSALDELIQLARYRGYKAKVSRDRGWTREDLYEERMSRYDKPVLD